MSDVPPRTPPTQPGFVHTVGQVSTGLAVTALVCGILGVIMCPPVGFVAIATGIIAIARCNSRPQQYGGRGLAIAGLVCGICSLFTALILGSLLLSIFVPSLARARELSRRLVCASNMKSISTSMQLYRHDHPGQGSPSLDSLVEMGELDAQTLVCPTANLANYVLSWPQSGSVSTNAVVIHEPSSNHGEEGGNVAHPDGTVAFLKGEAYDQAVRHACGP